MFSIANIVFKQFIRRQAYVFTAAVDLLRRKFDINTLCNAQLKKSNQLFAVEY